MRAPWIVALLALSTACADSDGEAGNAGVVRFSQVLDYGETSDFSAPIAVGRPLFLALQRPKTGFLDDETFAELTLRVEGPNGAEVGSVWPFGFAQYGVMFETPGVYTLIAERDGAKLDSLPVTVAPLDRIELSPRVQVGTRYQDGRESCTSVEEIDGLENVVLHANQRISLYVVPRDANGRPMLGLLALSAKPVEGLLYDAPLFGQSRRANALWVIADGVVDGTATLNITDEDTGETVTTTFETSSDIVPLDCD